MNPRSLNVAEIKRLLAEAPPEKLPKILKQLQTDNRVGVKSLIKRYKRKLHVMKRETNRIYNLTRFERLIRDRGFQLIAGVDEAGRGALAGPLVAAAVILPPEVTNLTGLNDSKMLSPKFRDFIYEKILKESIGIGVAVLSSSEVDCLGIQRANQAALSRAVKLLKPAPDYVLTDRYGLELDVPTLGITTGDRTSLSVAAASVVAKVKRDRLMLKSHSVWPLYGFDFNKGYGTAEHLEALRVHGACPLHRRSFQPVRGIH